MTSIVDLHLRLPIVGHRTATYGTPRMPFAAPSSVMPAAMPDFGSEAELEVERQAHAETRAQLVAITEEAEQLRRLLFVQSKERVATAMIRLAMLARRYGYVTDEEPDTTVVDIGGAA